MATRPQQTRMDNSRVIRSPRGLTLNTLSWATEAPLRMLMNNLDPEVAERPEELTVYGGIGRAARDWESFDRIVDTLKRLKEDETLLVQSGKPVGVFRTHKDAPRVLIANSNLVPKWATWDHFNHLDKLGLMMYGQMIGDGAGRRQIVGRESKDPGRSYRAGDQRRRREAGQPEPFGERLLDMVVLEVTLRAPLDEPVGAATNRLSCAGRLDEDSAAPVPGPQAPRS